MRLLKVLLILVCASSCSKADDEAISTSINTLAIYINDGIIETGAVIACAASAEVTNDVLVFYYPESDATNIQLFKTETALVDPLNYSNYTKSAINNTPFFNGYLGKYTLTDAQEKWIIVTFELNGEIKLSNPIRTKQITKPTTWNSEVTVVETSMPSFQWEANALGDNAIYFQVLSSLENDLLSGTYTFENSFQYYNLSNVVLNITTQPAPELQSNTQYNFTLMDVSEDNWVNLVSEKTFRVP